MSDDLEDTPAPRKGRGNAILTYERVDRILTAVTEVGIKLDHLVVDQKEADEDAKGLELRVRALESQVVQFVTSQTSGRHTALYLWGAAQTAITTVLAILTYLNKH